MLAAVAAAAGQLLPSTSTVQEGCMYIVGDAAPVTSRAANHDGAIMRDSTSTFQLR